MSKVTIAIVAAASAATGAIATAALYSSRKVANSSVSASSAPVAPAWAPPPTVSKPVQPAVQTPPPPQLPGPPISPAAVFQYGLTGPIHDQRAAASLYSSYDRRTRNPAWVAEHITRESLANGTADRKHSVFSEDTDVPEKFRALLKDYFRSGYDRGHQVPAADAKWSQQAMDDTFVLSNIAPQVGQGFNRDYWAHFEDFCRRLTGKYPSVRIVTGPLYLPRRDPDGKWRVSYEVIGSPPSVAVPTHFFKILYAEDGRVGGDVALGAFVLPNAPIPNDKPLKDFEVPLEAVERASGLEFAEKLPSTRRKQLCKEIECSIIIKEYKQRQQAFSKKG
ncbi:hypothetical protein EJ06DRAFT_529835 [Trichodelitschia bisporula]|uniref:Endonuclease n=1 Tax=Trichodelitschia bisporula TaxID=703511 RepID=A0A6G1HXI4_9PEZI|nr:hypothetical protein EJ06DRAFT_529835 [Trichodelitschia bisporula]